MWKTFSNSSKKQWSGEVNKRVTEKQRGEIPEDLRSDTVEKKERTQREREVGVEPAHPQCAFIFDEPSYKDPVPLGLPNSACVSALMPSLSSFSLLPSSPLPLFSPPLFAGSPPSYGFPVFLPLNPLRSSSFSRLPPFSPPLLLLLSFCASCSARRQCANAPWHILQLRVTMRPGFMQWPHSDLPQHRCTEALCCTRACLGWGWRRWVEV